MPSYRQLSDEELQAEFEESKAEIATSESKLSLMQDEITELKKRISDAKWKKRRAEERTYALNMLGELLGLEMIDHDLENGKFL